MSAKSRRIIYIMTNRCGQVSIHAPRVGRDGERFLRRRGRGERVARGRGERVARGRGERVARGRGWFQFTRPAWGASRGEAATLRAGGRGRAVQGGGEGAKQLPFPCVFLIPAWASARVFLIPAWASARVFLIPALRDSRAKIMRKKIFCGWCDMGKIRKNPNKTGVYGG